MIKTAISVIYCNVLMSKSGFVYVQVSVSYDDGPGGDNRAPESRARAQIIKLGYDLEPWQVY